MINAYFGEYHSGLEKHFFKTLKNAICRRKDELKEKILVIVPSSYLQEYLIMRLLTESEMPFVNVYFLTLDALARDIFSVTSSNHHLIDSSIFFAKLLQEILKGQKDKFCQYISKSYNASFALYNSIKDLYDANLSPDELFELIEFIEEEESKDQQFQQSYHKDLELLQNVAKSYSIFYQTLLKKNIVNNSQLLQICCENIANHSFCEGVKQLFWYGFYDATQVQFDFIEAVTRECLKKGSNIYFYSPIDTTEGEIIPECKYARLFFQDLVILINSLGKDNKIEYLRCKKGQASGGVEYCIIRETEGEFKISDCNISIFSCAGPYEEVVTCAKEILTLVDSGKYNFNDIAVIARNIEPYSSYIKTVFKDNNIPFWGELQDNLVSNPVCRFILNILYMCINNMSTKYIIEVISHYRYKYPPQPDIRFIENILKKLHIETSDDWGRLTSLYQKFDSGVIRYLLGESITAQDLKKVSETLEKVRDIMSELILIKKGTISNIAAILFNILKKHFIFDTKEIDFLGKLFSKFSVFDYLEDEYNLDEFTSIFEEILKNTKESNENDNGVLICDVMKFRGLSSKVIFILGMNKDVFPREIVPEPFISDYIRYKIDYLAGTKIKHKRRIAIKEMGYDEELILFYYMLKSATDKLYFSYQRVDVKGNLLSPSYYLERITYKTGECEKSIPKDLTGKYKFYKNITNFFPSRNELGVLISLSDNAPAIFPAWFEKQYKIENPQECIKTIVNFAEKINTDNECSEVDGFLTSKAEDIMKHLKNSDGKIPLSQSALSNYKKCPFMFFAEKILNINEVDEEPEKEFIRMVDMGNMADLALKYYLQQKGILKKPVDKKLLDESIDYVRNIYENILNPEQVNYALEKLKVAINNFLCDDERYKEFNVTIPQGEKEKEMDNIILSGIPDAIFENGNFIQIVDFKYGSKKYSSAEKSLYDKGLLQFIIYPLLYLDNSRKKINFKYENLATYLKYRNSSYLKKLLAENNLLYLIQKGKGEFLKDFEDTFGRISNFDAIEKYIRLLQEEIIGGILKCIFIIHKEAFDLSQFNICSYCNFFLICRRNHFPTQKRILKKWGQGKK